MGSRSLQIGGQRAVHARARRCSRKAKQLAAHLLEANVDDIVLRRRRPRGRRRPGERAVVGRARGRARQDPTQARRRGWSPRLAHELDFDQGEATFPFGAHIAVVEVDTETGRVELLRHVAVDDCGRILNPLLVAGQQHGGIAQGVAQALYEGVSTTTTATRSPRTSWTTRCRARPSSRASRRRTPRRRRPLNPLGAKGIGESGTIGSTPAVQNAVVDALSHLGVRHIDMPLTAERVWRAIQERAA